MDRRRHCLLGEFSDLRKRQGCRGRSSLCGGSTGRKPRAGWMHISHCGMPSGEPAHTAQNDKNRHAGYLQRMAAVCGPPLVRGVSWSTFCAPCLARGRADPAKLRLPIWSMRQIKISFLLQVKFPHCLLHQRRYGFMDTVISVNPDIEIPINPGMRLSHPSICRYTNGSDLLRWYDGPVPDA